LANIKVLDGIRGIAALLVLWAHFPTIEGGLALSYFQQSSRIFYSGYLGVDIFFALSGFLITRILLREKSEGRLSFKRFYWKRTVRIFPLYYLVICLVGLLISWENLGWSAAYISNYYFSFDSVPNALRHTWSLCVEEHFYLFWPLLISMVSISNARTFITYVLPIAAVLSAMAALLLSEHGAALVNKATHIRVLTISLGALLAFYESSFPVMGKKHQLLLFTLMILMFAGLASSHLFIDVRLMTFNRYVMSACSSISFLALILVIQSQAPKNMFVGFLHNPFFTFFGKISYGVYLYHLPILYFFDASHMNDEVSVSKSLALFLLLLCIGVPTASFYLFEKPILRWKNWVK